MYLCYCTGDVYLIFTNLFFKQIVRSPDLQLWLDATDETTMVISGNEVNEWRSKDATRRALRSSSFDVPLFHPPVDFSPASIEFDYNRTMTIDRPLTDIKTVISVHKYKDTVSSYGKDHGYEYFFKSVAVLVFIEKIEAPR